MTQSAENALHGHPVRDRDACGKCGREIAQVDLYGTPFFTHKPRPDCLTWWHIDQRRNNHQAEPLRTPRRAPRLIPPVKGES